MYKGIGETLATMIVNERNVTAFRDVDELINRVKGLLKTLHYHLLTLKNEYICRHTKSTSSSLMIEVKEIPNFFLILLSFVPKT